MTMRWRGRRQRIKFGLKGSPAAVFQLQGKGGRAKEPPA